MTAFTCSRCNLIPLFPSELASLIFGMEFFPRREKNPSFNKGDGDLMKFENFIPIRLGIPSKGRMEQETLDFLKSCGLTVKRIRRQYLATIEEIPGLQIVFQRQEDIVQGVENGLLTFGIAGYDLVSEIPTNSENIVVIHNGLDFGKCTLEVAVPETWPVSKMSDIKELASLSGKQFRVATKFPKLTSAFLDKYGIPFAIASGAGTLEVSPALGNAEFIVDLVSTGQTIEDNRLKRLEDGCILASQATFIGNKQSLLKNAAALKLAKTLLEIFEATLRAKKFVSVFANMRGDPEKQVQRLLRNPALKGLQGPTVSRIMNDEQDWFAIHIMVEKKKLIEVIEGLRSVGGSGVVVSPTTYIFEEEPPRYLQLLASLGLDKTRAQNIIGGIMQ